VGRVQKAKESSPKSEICSFTHLTQSEILIAHNKKSQVRAVAAESRFLSLKFGPRNRDSSHGDGFK
jgi:hypothetical protein